MERIAFTESGGTPRLRLQLSTYHALGKQWVAVEGIQMQPGELISLDYTLKMYLGPIH